MKATSSRIEYMKYCKYCEGAKIAPVGYVDWMGLAPVERLKAIKKQNEGVAQKFDVTSHDNNSSIL